MNRNSLNIFVRSILEKVLKVVFLKVFLFSTFAGIAQDPLSLEDAVRTGLQNNFQIQIYREQAEVAKLSNTWGTVGRFPSISIGATSINRYDDMPSQTLPDERSQFHANRIAPFANVNWILFNGFSVRMNKEKLRLLEDFSVGYSTLIIENTVMGIILGYYKALLEQEKLEILKVVKKLSSDRYHYEEVRKEFGSSVTFDVLQAKNAFLSDSTNFLLQQLNVKNAFLNLNLLLGEQADKHFILTDSFNVETPQFIYDDLLNAMLANNRNLQNQYINQEILKKDISIKKSALYPVVSMNAGADYFESRIKLRNTDPYNTNAFDYYANFTLSFNLFNGGNTRRAIEQAGIREKIGQLEFRELELTLVNYLTTLVDLYSIRKQLLDVARSNIESARLNLEISTERYRQGTINSFNFRDVQLIFLNASFRELESIYNLIDSQVEISRLTGGILSEY